MTVKRALWLVVGLGLGAVVLGVVDARYVLAPLLGLAIWRVGIASFGSLRAGGAHIPDGPPEPVDPRTERISYRCSGCGAEMLLLMRGAAVPPRHCGERMTEHREVARRSLG